MGSLAGAMPMNDSLDAPHAPTPKLSYAQAVGASSFGASSEAAKAFRSAASQAAVPRRRPLGAVAEHTKNQQSTADAAAKPHAAHTRSPSKPIASTSDASVMCSLGMQRRWMSALGFCDSNTAKSPRCQT